MILSRLRPEGMQEWRIGHGWSRPVAADRMGLSTSAVEKYESGTRAIPLIVALAMAALDHDLPPVGGGQA